MQFLIRTVHIHRPTRLLGLMGAVLGLSSWSARWWAGANTYFREIGAALGSADSGLDADVLTTEPVRSFPDDVQQLVITSYHHALRESGAWCGVTPLSATTPHCAPDLRSPRSSGVQHHPQRRVHYPQLLDAQMADAVPQTSRVHRHRLFHHDAGPGAGDLDPGPEGGRPAACRSASRTAVDTEVPSTVSSSRARRVS